MTATGCGAAGRELAPPATGASVAGPVGGGADRARDVDPALDRQVELRLGAGIDEELVAKATDRIVSGVVDGTLASFDDPTRRLQVRQTFAELTDGLRLPLSIERIDKRAIGDVVDESFARLLSDERQVELRLAARALAKEVVAGAFEQAREEMGGELALSSAVRDAAKQATLGFQDAIDETGRKKRSGDLPAQEGNLLAAAGGSGFVWVVVLVVGLALALVGAIVWVGRRKRATQAELARRDDGLLALAEAIKATKGEPWGDGFRKKLDHALRDRDGAAHLRRLLRSRARPHRAHAHKRSGLDSTP